MPDYQALARLFLEPLMDNAGSLVIDSEVTRGGHKVWLRVAFDARDKGRVFGRGGRTLQAIRQVLEATAQMAGQTLSLDVYDPHPYPAEVRGGDRKPTIKGRSKE
jgi:hypothetical protein